MKKFTPKEVYLFLKHYVTARPAAGPQQADESLGVVDLGLDLDRFYRELLSFEQDFQFKKLLDVDYKDKKFPVYEININRGGTKKLFVLSGTHGNEQAGILVIPKFLEEIKNGKVDLGDTSIRIITPHNPVGAKYFSRFSEQGFDLNRDLKLLQTQANQVVIRSLEDFQPDLTVSHHEGPQDGAFVFVNPLVEERFVDQCLKYMKDAGVKLATHSYMKNKLKKSGYFRIEGLATFFVKVQSKILEIESFGINMINRSIPNLTLETNWQSDDPKERTEVHLIFLKSVIRSMEAVK